MIASKQELEEIIERINSDLQAVQDYLGRKNEPDGRIRFPRGFIRTAAEIRDSLPSLKDNVLRRNISYTLMTADVLRWLAIRTDLFGTAKEMIVKEGVCLLGSVCESLTKHLLRGIVGNKKSFKDRTKKLVEMKIISPQLKGEVDWVWDTRNNEHLFLLEDLELGCYKVADYNRAFRAYVSLRDALKKHFC